MCVDTKEYLEYLIEEYSDTVYRLAISRLRNKENAEDVYQEVFLRLSKKIPKFESKEHEKAWIIRVTINCSKTLLGSKHLKSTEELSLQDGSYIDNPDDKNDVLLAVLQLPIRYRTVIHLFYYEGYKIEEISEILGAKENTVKSWLMRARKKLKSEMEGGLDDE